jgi:hypothetical protein
MFLEYEKIENMSRCYENMSQNPKNQNLIAETALPAKLHFLTRFSLPSSMSTPAPFCPDTHSASLPCGDNDTKETGPEKIGNENFRAPDSTPQRETEPSGWPARMEDPQGVMDAQET